MLDDASLLLAWERGYGRAPFEQALVLLGIAFPNTTADDLMNLSIGKRDAALLTLRKRLFGERLESLATCPECNETLELSFRVDDITVDAVSWPESSDIHRVELDGLWIEYRLPTSRDLLLLASLAPGGRGDQLLQQCVSHVRRDEQVINLSDLSSQTRTAISQAIADSEPQANVQLALACLGCGHQWSPAFDIVGFLWAELNVWCQRLLAEIHLLAKAYGWSEAAILALSHWRRQVYLSMVRQ